MSYKTGALHVTRLVGIGPGGREHDGAGEAGTIALEHSCDEWEIGSAVDARQLIHDLQQAMIESEQIVREGPEDPILARAFREGWQYYCALCRRPFSGFYGDDGSLAHQRADHPETTGPGTAWGASEKLVHRAQARDV